jgi:hypothetical protein
MKREREGIKRKKRRNKKEREPIRGSLF